MGRKALKINVVSCDGAKELDGWPTLCPGLLVTERTWRVKTDKRRWTLTHTASGFNLGVAYRSRAAALRALVWARAGTVDWTRAGEELRGDKAAREVALELKRTDDKK